MKKHLLEAAERGNAEAQFNLGIMCENGFDDSRYIVEGDKLQAEKWFLAAAEQGLPRAQIKLAEIYADQSKPPENWVKACALYLLASTSLRGAQLQGAQFAYQRAVLRLTPDQMIEVENLVKAGKSTSVTTVDS
jgi:TPR repeat protein